MRLKFCTLPLFAFVLVACGEEAETSAFDVGTSLELDVELIDRGVPDMSFDQMLESDSARPDATLTDMAVLPSSADCTSWADVTNAQLVSTLHQHLVNTYVPITPTPNFGGNPDRYTTARQLMFTRVERFQRDDEVYVVQCIYTNDTEFTPPDRDPDDDAINCEHIWPRARLDSDRSSRLYEHQQSDIHHLAPSRPSANSLRGSLPFGEVVRDANRSAEPSVEGRDERGDRVFEPQDSSKGDIARVLFYMSIRWGLNITGVEEMYLRQWHNADPVSLDEQAKNDERANIQGNRNPFIDCPNLVDRIDEFDAFTTVDTLQTLPFP